MLVEVFVFTDMPADFFEAKEMIVHGGNDF